MNPEDPEEQAHEVADNESESIATHRVGGLCACAKYSPLTTTVIQFAFYTLSLEYFPPIRRTAPMAPDLLRSAENVLFKAVGLLWLCIWRVRDSTTIRVSQTRVPSGMFVDEFIYLCILKTKRAERTFYHNIAGGTYGSNLFYLLPVERTGSNELIVSIGM